MSNNTEPKIISYQLVEARISLALSIDDMASKLGKIERLKCSIQS